MTKLTVEDWRLTPGFVAFVSVKGKDRKVWLCARDKKVYKTALKKEIPAEIVIRELNPDLNEVELKFSRQTNEWGEEAAVFIRNSEVFPDDSWYQVMNFYQDHLINFILDTSPVKGEFPGQIFEAIFSETNPTQVSFVSPEMGKYNDYFEEMRRRLNVELGRKAKKWVPGHRYDTLKESYYYLGTLLSRKVNESNSEFLPDSEMQPVHLYVSSIRSDEKSVSDILKSRTIGTDPEDIKILRATASAFDAGEVLVDDLGDDVRVYWNEMLDNAVESCKSVIDGGNYVNYVDTRKIFDVLSLQSPDHLDYPAEISNKVAEIVKKLSIDVIFMNYGMTHADRNLDVNSGLSTADNVKAIIRNLCYKTRDPNIVRTSYYSALMAKLGINSKDIAEEALNLFSEPSLSIDFDTFNRYSFYFNMRKQDYETTSRQRNKSALYKSDVNTVESMLGGGELTDCIKKLFNYARDNFGLGSDSFNIYNVGTKKAPNEYVHCVITLRNLIDFVGGPEKLSDQLKKEILSTKFTRITINADKDSKIE